MNILITGANGFLGRHLMNYLSNRGFTIFATNRGMAKGVLPETVIYIELDLTNELKLQEIVTKIQPNVIIHTAAMSKPDECENNRELCISQNVTTVKYLTKICRKNNSKLIFTSTDFVFGSGNNLKENIICQPLNFYGESKLAAEEIIVNAAINYCILRPAFIYGKRIEGIRNSFVQLVADNLMANKSIRIVNDQLRTPTYVLDICKVIEQIIIKNATGIFHIAGFEIVTPYQIAIQVAKKLKLDENLITAADGNNFIEPAKRAKKCILNTDKAKEQLNFNPINFSYGLEYCF